MMSKRNQVATQLSWFLWVGGIAACEAGSQTSLDGRITCGEIFCETGQVCASMEAGVDAAVPGKPIFHCQTPRDGCIVSDCIASGCPDCIRDLCFPNAEGYGIELEGRYLSCPGI